MRHLPRTFHEKPQQQKLEKGRQEKQVVCMHAASNKVGE